MTFRLPPRVLLGDAAQVLSLGAEAIRGGEREFDAGGVEASDSSLIACALAWQRAAGVTGEQLRFVNLPDRVRSLAGLYGVEQIAFGQ